MRRVMVLAAVAVLAVPASAEARPSTGMARSLSKLVFTDLTNLMERQPRIASSCPARGKASRVCLLVFSRRLAFETVVTEKGSGEDVRFDVLARQVRAPRSGMVE